MLGCKNSVKPLLKLLSDLNVPHYIESKFIQGRTTRWALAWTFGGPFKHKIDSPNKKEKNRCLSFVIPPIETMEYAVKDISLKVLEILKKLDIQYKVYQQKDVIWTIEMRANSNTWSNQRRKRRMEMMKNSSRVETSETNVNLKEENNTNEIGSCIDSGAKRKCDEKCVFSKKIKSVDGNTAELAKYCENKSQNLKLNDDFKTNNLDTKQENSDYKNGCVDIENLNKCLNFVNGKLESSLVTNGHINPDGNLNCQKFNNNLVDSNYLSKNSINSSNENLESKSTNDAMPVLNSDKSNDANLSFLKTKNGESGFLNNNFEDSVQKHADSTSLNLECSTIDNCRNDSNLNGECSKALNDDEIHLKAALCVRKNEDYIVLEVGYMSGVGGRDSVHQVVQYIKNNWK